MDLHFYPYDFDYKIKGEKVLVYLYGKTDAGKKICVIQEHQPFFYARLAGVDKELLLPKLANFTLETREGIAKIISWEEVEKELLGKKEKFLKIFTNFPKAVPPLSRELESWGLHCYERDILFIHRYLRDKGITPMTLVKATGSLGKEENLRLPAFFADTIEQESKEALASPKILAIDIETYSQRREIDPHKNPILMVGLYGVDENGKEFQKVLTWKRFAHHLEYIEYVQDEVELLRRFRDLVVQYDPDIITGYFTDGFDFPYLKTRADKHKVMLDICLDGSELSTGSGGGGSRGSGGSSSSQATFREGEAKIKGMLHLDMLKFIRNIFGKDLKTESFSLDAVAGELLGHGKHPVNVDELSHVWDQEPERLADFCAYNLHDAHLANKLCRQLLPDMMEFTKLIGLPTFDLIRMRFSRLVENYILKRALEFNVIAPNKPADQETEERREKSIEGAFVLEPAPGLYQNIIVFDFRSLYPTIITAHNIGPEGFRCGCCAEKEHVPEKDEYWFCQREKKFLPSVLEELILRRADLKRLVKEEKAKGNDTKILEARSYALKILANSFYGYLGFYGARWYSIESAASTTAYARNYIKQTIEKAKEKGFEVIYSDTDSLFITLGSMIRDQALEFMNEINFDLPGHMELEFQGFYPQGLFVAQKGTGGEKGAKKRYALLDEKGKVKITGFETVRRNWSKIGKEVQEKVLSLVLTNQVEAAVQYVKETVKKLKKGEIPLRQLIIKTQITRELDDYASVGPHVTVARRMQGLGERVLPGTLIEYVITKGVGLVRERAKLPSEAKEGEYDADYYINHQLLPAVAGIFAVLGYSEEDLFKESSQVGLGKFL